MIGGARCLDFLGGSLGVCSSGTGLRALSVGDRHMGFLPFWFSHKHPCVLFHRIMVFAAGRQSVDVVLGGMLVYEFH